MNRKSQLSHLDRKAIRRIVKVVKLVARLASIFKAFDFIVSLFDRE
jgi:hypothetical protein